MNDESVAMALALPDHEAPRMAYRWCSLGVLLALILPALREPGAQGRVSRCATDIGVIVALAGLLAVWTTARSTIENDRA